MEYNIIARTVDLPICVKGVTVPDAEGTYNIYINAKYNEETQREILKHELRHIKNFDFDNFDDIKIIEERARVGL